MIAPRISQHVRSRQRGPAGTASALDESLDRISGDKVAAYHDVDVAALLKVRIEGRLAGRTPARLPGTAAERLTILRATSTTIRVLISY